MLNKTDTVTDRVTIDVLRARFENPVSISAKTGQGLDRLTQLVADRLADGYVNARIETSVSNGRMLAYLATHAEVSNTEYSDDGKAILTCRIPRALLSQINRNGSVVHLQDSLPEQEIVD